ncbi:MAG TPA: hypothetical protein VF483_04895, partial [Gemmatimonadaceae bacterium]
MQLRAARVLAGLVVLGIASGEATAQQATQVVHFRVDAVSQLAVSGNPAPLVVSAAIAGQSPASATASTTTYAISTNESNQKIVASLDQQMPSGTNLEVTLAAPTGASSRGAVALATSGADLVTGISTTAASDLPITYRLSASVNAVV